MKHFVLFGILVILVTACQKENIEIPDTGRRIVINGLITTDNLLNVRIGESVFLTDISGKSVETMDDLVNADVRFYRNEEYIDSLYHKTYWFPNEDWDEMFRSGNYMSEGVFPLPGKEYKIIVKAPDLPDAYSSIIIPEPVRIAITDTFRVITDTLEIPPFPGSPEEDTLFLPYPNLICDLEFTDPSDEVNYYLFNIYLNFYYFHKKFRYPHFVFDCKDPVAEEKLLSNYQPLEGFAFTDKIINGKKYKFRISINGGEIGKPFINNWPGDDYGYRKTIYFRLYSITGDFYRYIQALNLYHKSFDNPLADQVIVPCNIKGGYGFFTGAAVSSDSIVFIY